MRPPRPPSKLDALNWIWEARDQHGLYIHPNLAFIHSRASGYAIASATTSCLKEGTVVARTPKACIISPRTTHVPLRTVLETVDWPAIMKLALVFLYEFSLKKASRFDGYNMLFRDDEGGLVVPDVPRLWSAEDKEYLGGTEIADRRGDSDADAMLVFKSDIKPFMDKYPKVFNRQVHQFVTENWVKGLVLVGSRCFYVDNFHNLSLVPIADLFNHRRPGSEDVNFESHLEVCNQCGKPESSCFCPPDCEYCAQRNETRCICRPSKRMRLNNHSPDEIDDDEPILKTVEVAVLDPKTGVWTTQKREIQDPSIRHDTCDMVLTRDINECRQLYNNYGNLNNQKLVSTYGFFDPKCKTDFVSLHQELFHGTSLVSFPPQLARFWMDHGFETVQQLAEEYELAKARWDELILYRDSHIPTTGEEFVHWSLSITDKGPTITCLVWTFLCHCFHKKACPDRKEIEGTIKCIFSQIYGPPGLDFDCRNLIQVITILVRAVQLRCKRYQVATRDVVKTSLRLAESNIELEEIARWKLAMHMKDLELRFLNDCGAPLRQMAKDAQGRCKVDHRHQLPKGIAVEMG